MRNGSLYLHEKNEKKYKRVFINALAANAMLTVFKLGLGIFGYSKLVLIDGIFAFSNTVVLFLTWYGDGVERREPSEKHPYGYGKALFLIVSMAGLVILILSIYMFMFGINSMSWLEIHRSHSGAMMITLISIVANEFLYRYLRDEGRRYSNNVLAWNAVNNRINALTSLLILFCIILASMGNAYFERLGVIAVSLILFSLSLRILVMSFAGIMDKIPTQKVLDRIRSYAQKAKGVKDVVDIKARNIGTFLYIDLLISVDENLRMIDGDKIARSVEAVLIDNVPFTAEANVIIS